MRSPSLSPFLLAHPSQELTLRHARRPEGELYIQEALHRNVFTLHTLPSFPFPRERELFSSWYRARAALSLLTCSRLALAPEQMGSRATRLRGLVNLPRLCCSTRLRTAFE